MLPAVGFFKTNKTLGDGATFVGSDMLNQGCFGSPSPGNHDNSRGKTLSGQMKTYQIMYFSNHK